MKTFASYALLVGALAFVAGYAPVSMADDVGMSPAQKAGEMAGQKAGEKAGQRVSEHAGPEDR